MCFDSIVSRQLERKGWNTIIRRTLDYTALRRIDTSVVALVI